MFSAARSAPFTPQDLQLLFSPQLTNGKGGSICTAETVKLICCGTISSVTAFGLGVQITFSWVGKNFGP